MRVFIAEKPSLAAAIFKGLGGNTNDKKQGYYQKGSDIVTWCFGHLLCLKNPEDMDDKYKSWSLDTLPIPTQYPPQYKPRADSKKQLNTVLSLIKQAETIVAAGDPDPEGNYLIDEILTYCNNQKPVLRLLIADLNDEPVKKALANMQPNENFKHLTYKAMARAIADQIYGYNLTRAYTLKAREKGFDAVLNIGRVITTLIGMVNERTLANERHVKSFYYDVTGHMQINDQDITAKLQPHDDIDMDEKNRFISDHQVYLIQEAAKNETATITSIVTNHDKRPAPMPFNLSKLQIEASNKWGYKPKQTLDIVQSLYETHKLLTYPRSDNQFLSDAHLAHSESILTAIKHTAQTLSDCVEQAASTSTHKAFNAAKIEGHHAIIPTEKNGEHLSLTEQERNIYELVAKRFIALFYPASIREKTVVDIRVLDRPYRATQTYVDSQGWEVIFKGEHIDDKNANPFDLKSLKEGSSGCCTAIDVVKKEAQPPKYFTDATLLKAMTEAAKFIKDPHLRKQLEAKDKNTKGENGSIGTEATRSGHIEKLGSLKKLITMTKEKGYKTQVYKTTPAGQQFCALLPEEIIMPDLSAIWEGNFDQIAKGHLSVPVFIKAVDSYITEQVNAVKANGVNITLPDAVPCPVCQQGKLIRRKGKNGYFHACHRYPDCKTVFPDVKGKPNLSPTPKTPSNVKKSETEFCKQCGHPLIRRPSKKAGTFWWGCSGFPKCKVRFFDRDGKPDRDKGEL
ncbi:DNA topoisomerase 3 [Photobacterium angustum]|uniref:DNA topoisomerase 3 n=1 Tax=Photobacterium angustum TaxID=661 RepID=UPI003D11E664